MKQNTQTNTGELIVYTYEGDFAAFVEARDEGELCVIDEAMFDYWLEVLPPVAMGARNVPLCTGRILQRADFLFAEGAELCTAFWRAREPQGTVHYAQLSQYRNRG